MNEITKVSGRIYKRDEQGNLILRGYERVLYDWLAEKSPKKFDTQTIADALRMPYDTIQPKLKWLATSEDCPEELRIKMSKETRAMGQRGRKKYLWSVE